MPNWCDTYIGINAPEHIITEIKEVLSAEEPELLKHLCPYEGEWNQDWCVENWGTKWEAQDCEIIKIDPDDNPYEPHDLHITCQTAWTAPTNAFMNWLKRTKIPNVRVDVCYKEFCVGFWGRDVLETNHDGELDEATYDCAAPQSIQDWIDLIEDDEMLYEFSYDNQSWYEWCYVAYKTPEGEWEYEVFSDAVDVFKKFLEETDCDPVYRELDAIEDCRDKLKFCYENKLILDNEPED